LSGSGKKGIRRVSEQKAKERFAPIKTESELRMEEQKKDSTPTIYLVMSTCGLASGAAETKQAFEEALSEKSIQARIIPVGCLGHCYAEPLVIIDHPGAGFPPICYYQINADRARILVRSYLEGGDPVLKYVLGAMEENDVIPAVMDFPRFNLEQRLVMEHCGLIDPDDIHQYIARGGYSALVKALDSTPDEVIDLIAQSGLRGRGGAGFPTGRKWRIAKTAEADGKFVICNGDEGDPGAYMDRTILESNPHQLLEGLAICAYAVGADRAIVYVRAEYPLAVKAIKQAIKSAEELSLLGPSILGTSFDLQVSVFQGSGAFVCGEETALIQSICR
jgi:NADH-quinone oxidoreductase subunit F